MVNGWDFLTFFCAGIAITLAVIGILDGLGVYHIYTDEELLRECNCSQANVSEGELRCEYFQMSMERMRNVQGAYSADDNIMCVWISNRTADNIERTTTHEVCHAIVDNNYDHYCNTTKYPQIHPLEHPISSQKVGVKEQK